MTTLSAAGRPRSAIGVLTAVATLLVFSFPASADPEAAASPTRKLGTTGRVWLEGDSTLHKYRAEANSFDAHFEIVEGADGASPKDLGAAVQAGKFRSFDLVLPAKRLTSGEPDLDKNMYKALKAQAHPLITFHMLTQKVLPLARPDVDSFQVAAGGTLTVAGVSRPVDLVVNVVRTEQGLHLTGAVPMRMSEYGIKPPSFMLGALKTRDPVTVNFDLQLKP